MFTLPVVKATRLIRTMLGQTRAQLIVADDGQRYVVKYINNPIGRRALVNELISSLTLKNLRIRTPSIALVSFDEEMMARNPEVGIASAGGIAPPLQGLHFGCRYPGYDSMSIYDFIPDRMLSQVENRTDFIGALAFDKWFSNADLRQAVFYRHSAVFPTDAHESRQWFAEMIDQHSTFCGQEWTFRNSLQNSPPEGLYPRLAVYGDNPTMRDFEPWLERIEGLDAAFFQLLLRAIPAQWIAGEEEQVSKLLCKLQDRRYRLPGLVEEAVVYIQASLGRAPLAVDEAIKRIPPTEDCLAG